MRDLHTAAGARELRERQLANYLKNTARAPADETRKYFEILAELMREEIVEAGAQPDRRRARGVA
jgi:hypothetical protein